jgi:hypothetical protein
MISFSEFLEGKMVGNQTNMKLVGDLGKSATKAAVDAFVDYSGYGLAKSVFDAALSQRKNVTKKIQDDAAIRKSKEIIKSRISQKAQNRLGNIDAIVDSYVSATDESQAFLNDQEHQLVVNAIYQAVDNGSIKSGFAQELVNGILQEKINAIQNVLDMSKPKKIVI